MDQTNKKEKGFLNVYNFIPFPNKKSKSYTEEDRHTGVIEYNITTETPLFIPNTSNENTFELGRAEEGHKSYDFYSYTELEGGKTYNNSYQSPVIPGSELRGMIRNIYETITGSCMSVLNSEIFPVKRSCEIFQPGLLVWKEKEDSLTLVEAKDNVSLHYKGTKIEKEYKEGQKLYIVTQSSRRGPDEVIKYDTKKTGNAREEKIGYLIKGMDGPANKKHNAHIFIPQKKEVKKGLTRKEVEEKLKGVLESYQSQPEADKNSYKEYEQSLEKFLKREGEECFPVYYSMIEYPKNKGNFPIPSTWVMKNEDLLYMAPACITKEVSNHSIGELAGDMAPCSKEYSLCPACDLFGMVGASNEDSHASKVRFADAYPEKRSENKEYYEEIITLEALGTPKLGNTEFYLKKPRERAVFWTYDYYVEDEKVSIEAGELRGRKYYWHQYGVKLPKNIERKKLNKTIRPVKKGVTFKGKLFYNDISQKQLDQLLWILNNGSNTEEEKGLAYKLGGGKPLGLGSVTLKVEKVTERLISIKNNSLCYKENKIPKEEINIPNYGEAGFLSECKKAFFKMSSLHAADGMEITYPRTEDQRNQPMTEGYKWFVENHNTGRMQTKRIKMQIKHALPIAEEMRTLPYFQTKQKGRPLSGNPKGK